MRYSLIIVTVTMSNLFQQNKKRFIQKIVKIPKSSFLGGQKACEPFFVRALVDVVATKLGIILPSSSSFFLQRTLGGPHLQAPNRHFWADIRHVSL